MENFDPRPQEVKEKSFYVLNLDTPRIIILTSVVIGIIAAAFLFGMSFMKSDSSRPADIAAGGMQFNESAGNDLLNREIPPIPEEGTGDALPGTGELKTGTETLTAADPVKTETLASDLKTDKEDVLKNENIKEIIPPAREKKSSKHEKTASLKHRDKSSPKKIADGNVIRKNEPRGKSRIYEVSREEDTRAGYDLFSVQVASYDTLSKAETEKNLLKSRNYDAFIDRASVNGRSYFRVRIGPVSTKNKAGELLNDIQSDSRYSGSYIVKD